MGFSDTTYICRKVILIALREIVSHIMRPLILLSVKLFKMSIGQ